MSTAVVRPAGAIDADRANDLPYQGRWWGRMEVFDNAANINTRHRSAMRWRCRRSGELAGWRAWIKRRPHGSRSRDYSRGDGGRYRFALFASSEIPPCEPAKAAIACSELNAGFSSPLALRVPGKQPIEDGWINPDIPQFLTFRFERPVRVTAGRDYWLQFINEHPEPWANFSAWDNAIVEQKFPAALSGGLFFNGEPMLRDRRGRCEWSALVHHRGPNEAIYADGYVEGSCVTSAGAAARIDLSPAVRLRQRFVLPEPITADAVTGRIYYIARTPGPLLVRLEDRRRTISARILQPAAENEHPVAFPSARPHFATERRSHDVPSPFPAVPWLAALPSPVRLPAGEDLALTVEVLEGRYRTGLMSVWNTPNVNRCWTPDLPGCSLQMSRDGGDRWQDTGLQMTLALRRLPG